MTGAPMGVTDRRLSRLGFLGRLSRLFFIVACTVVLTDALRRLGMPWRPELIIDVIVIAAAVTYAPRYFARRLHDLDLSGWWLLIPVPVVTGLAWLGAVSSSSARTGIILAGLTAVAAGFAWLSTVRGTTGRNRYGDDPLDPNGWWMRGRADGPALTARAIRSRMRRLARPTLLLIPAKDARFSKLGGRPELPVDLSWPAGVKGPRAFLAQLDLSEVHAAGGSDWLPPEGRLYVFYDDERGGFADHASVAFSQAPPAGETPAPSELSAKLSFNERRVGFLPFTSIPSLDWLDVDVRALDVEDDDFDQLVSAPDEPFGDELQHRVGGYPSEIQNGQLALECEHLARGLPLGHPGPNTAIARAAKTWRLLLQVDSDPALKMNWGDAGRLYVFVRETDARSADFTKTVTIWQTH